MVVRDSGAVTRTFIAGGAGFIGSHMARRLLADPDQEVVVFDNLSSGTKAYLDDVLDHERLTFVTGDLQDLDATCAAIEGCGRMFLFAANPDIAKAVTEPAIDFWQGTYLTNNAIEAARMAGVTKIVYSSGSGVYGDRGEEAVREDAGGMHPVSTYGASKLACEAMMSAYSHMFGLHVVVFRFANVVGPRQTHGVTYDFVRRLREDPTRLTILGDGQQSKSYIHVSDVIDAMLQMADADGKPFDVLQRRDAGLRHRRGDRRPLLRAPRPLRCRLRRSPAAPAAGRATSRSCASTPTSSASWAGPTATARARR